MATPEVATDPPVQPPEWIERTIDRAVMLMAARGVFAVDFTCPRESKEEPYTARLVWDGDYLRVVFAGATAGLPAFRTLAAGPFHLDKSCLRDDTDRGTLVKCIDQSMRNAVLSMSARDSFALSAGHCIARLEWHWRGDGVRLVGVDYQSSPTRWRSLWVGPFYLDGFGLDSRTVDGVES